MTALLIKTAVKQDIVIRKTNLVLIVAMLMAGGSALLAIAVLLK
jgi:hypothetical protein